jgi:hypothetical protein
MKKIYNKIWIPRCKTIQTSSNATNTNQMIIPQVNSNQQISNNIQTPINIAEIKFNKWMSLFQKFNTSPSYIDNLTSTD